jgi:hypothetical protein
LEKFLTKRRPCGGTFGKPDADRRYGGPHWARQGNSAHTRRLPAWLSPVHAFLILKNQDNDDGHRQNDAMPMA